MTAAVDTLDAAAVRAWLVRAADALEADREAIDRLNVFPVADADTGTNLAVTVRAAAEAVSAGDEPAAGSAPSAGAVLSAAAAAAALAARGNSGVIAGQWLRGLADAVDGADRIDARALTTALAAAAKTARDAVSDPVEGTVLSVASAAAKALTDTADGPGTAGGLGTAVAVARAAAAAALAATPGQLDVLGRAGVVDAGGQGLLVVLDALVTTVTGAPPETRPEPDRPAPELPETAARACHGESGGHAWEVQYLLTVAAPPASPADRLGGLRAELDRLGTSVVLGRVDEARVRVHVHTDDVGAVLDAGLRAGTPSAVEVTALPAPAAPERADSAVLAVVDGDGVRAVFTRAGASTVALHDVDVGADADADIDAIDEPHHRAGALTDAIHAAAATGARVIVLPGGEPSVVVEQAAERAREGGADVTVVPTHSAVQGLAALAVHDPSRRFGDDLIAMAEAAAATRVAEVRVAGRAGLTMAGRCEPGDVLGSIAGEIVVIGHDQSAVAAELVDRLLAVGGELVTVLLGEHADPSAAEALTRHLAQAAPHAEIVVHDGGQADPPLIVGVE